MSDIIVIGEEFTILYITIYECLHSSTFNGDKIKLQRSTLNIQTTNDDDGQDY